MKSFDVDIEIEGEKYTATATVDGGMLTVRSMMFGEKSASVSASNEVLAKLLLHELVNESKGKGW
ncbi:MAG: hypothetical protein N0E58_04725 [Candidatus Thiodiazotropha endolucinida]|nr:hypothetical protein [Candidatus Thiodiazotropha endolucinida]